MNLHPPFLHPFYCVYVVTNDTKVKFLSIDAAMPSVYKTRVWDKAWGLGFTIMAQETWYWYMQLQHNIGYVHLLYVNKMKTIYFTSTFVDDYNTCDSAANIWNLPKIMCRWENCSF
jgi:hypothetical protein